MFANREGFYHYTKGHEKKGVWVPIESTNLARMTKETVGFTTILAVNERSYSGRSLSAKALYTGPYYLDIDSANIASAIANAKKAVATLRVYGVPDESIRVWATGKKGFHICVPMPLFTSDTEVEGLARIYGQISRDLGFAEFYDPTVYSTGKGRMWRRTGAKRVDNGAYKVPVTLKELAGLNAESYAAACNSPRPELDPPLAGPVVPKLGALYKRAKAKAEDHVQTFAFIDPEAHAQLKDEPNRLPPCANLMLQGEVREKVGFNAYSLQFAKAVRAFNPTGAKELIEQFAENAPGESYDDPQKRFTHCFGAFQRNTKNYGWSCRSALSVLPGEPCDGCPVVSLRFEAEESSEEPAEPSNPNLPPVIDLDSDEPIPVFSRDLPVFTRSASKPHINGVAKEAPAPLPVPVEVVSAPPEKEEPAPEPEEEDPQEEPQKKVEDFEFGIDPGNREGLVASEEGYAFIEGKGGMRMVSNFTLKVQRFFVEWVAELSEFRQVAVMAHVYIAGKKVGSAVIEETDWSSKSSFIRPFVGLSNTGWYGKDDDVTKLKVVIMDNLKDRAEHVVRVRSFGIFHDLVAGKHVFTYVEPGWSIDNYGNQDTYSMLGAQPRRAPELKPIDIIEKDCSVTPQILEDFFSLNEDSVSLQVMGWIGACFLKAHIINGIKREFPLINLYGNASAGKTQGAMRWCELFGTDYRGTADEVNLPSSTHFIRWQALVQSQTAPVVLDEYNKSKLQYREFNSVGELMKGAYQQTSIERGVLKAGSRAGFGAEAVGWPMTCPIIYTSEQPAVSNPALVLRSIQVPMKPAALAENGSAPRKAFNRLLRKWKEIKRLSKSLYMFAIKVPMEWVVENYEECCELVPMEIGDRPHHAYALSILGLRFFQLFNEEYRLGLDMGGKLKLYTTILENSMAMISSSKAKSECDLVLDTLSTMAAASEDERQRLSITGGLHYAVVGDELVIDMATAFPLYTQYVSQVRREAPPIDNRQALLALIKNEPYFLSATRKIPGFAKDRECMSFSMAKMNQKGIDVSSFGGDDDFFD